MRFPSLPNGDLVSQCKCFGRGATQRPHFAFKKPEAQQE